MNSRALTPVILGLLLLIAAAGLVFIGSGQLGRVAVLGGFIPLRLIADAELTQAIPGLLPVWITPLSATLIHGGLGHLFFNTLTLAIVGPQAERAMGKRGVVLLWLIGAYAAAAAQWAIDPASPVPMIGASGAVSAILGAYALLFGEQRARAIGPIPARYVQALWLLLGWTGINLVIGFAGAMSDLPIAAAAHVGGFVAGMLLLRPLLLWRWRHR